MTRGISLKRRTSTEIRRECLRRAPPTTNDKGRRLVRPPPFVTIVKTARGARPRRGRTTRTTCGLHPHSAHSAHTTHAPAATRHFLFLLFLDLADYGVRGQQQAGDARRVLKSDAFDFGWDEHAHVNHIPVLAG